MKGKRKARIKKLGKIMERSYGIARAGAQFHLFLEKNPKASFVRRISQRHVF
ncbi:MAG: hypothetical protein PHP03_01410 [Candidatus Pacebacteria bacterium]|nr:hypothetical protein [Candidatus Paceibacterota bacterium]